jgi:excisionase family DNA binding protein
MLARMGDKMVLSEVAALLGMSHTSVWRHVQAKRLPAERVGPIYLVDREAALAFKAQERKAGWPKGKPRKPAPAD